MGASNGRRYGEGSFLCWWNHGTTGL